MSSSRDRPKGICHFIAQNRKCKFGSTCKFSHTIAPSSSRGGAGGSSGRGGGLPHTSRPHIPRPRPRDWSALLSQHDALSPAPLTTTIQGGLDIVEGADSDAKQALIRDLGNEHGLQWIVRVFESTFELNPGSYNAKLGFHEHCVPFLRLISHNQILTSLIMEKEVGTIYNVLHGGPRRRGINCFERITATLRDAMATADDDQRTKCEAAIFAISATLYNVISLNQDAAIQKEYKTICTSLSQCFSEFTSDRHSSFALRSAARDIQRIKERLGMGEAIPNATYHTTATIFPDAEFQLALDPPGDLSLKGPRHDNDHAMIENISILPTTSEIKANRAVYLPLRNRAVPHHETGIHRLLDTQFRLLREDTSGQLQDAICALVARWETLVRGNDKNMKRKMLRQIDAKINIFDQVRIAELRFDRRKGMVIDVTFAQPSRASGLKPKERVEWWKESRDLQVGSLVALVDDTKETSFLLVADREVIKHGNNETGYRRQYHLIKDLASNPDRALIALTLVNPTSELDLARITALTRQSSAVSGAVLIEFPGLLFNSFEPILKCLQELHKQPNMPFTDWLAPSTNSQFTIRDGLVQVPPPLYMSEKRGVSLDLSCIAKDGHPLRFSLEQPVTVEALERHTTLDRGQCESLISCLSRELALVQGPPGTGKSYVGLQVVKVLMRNRDQLKLGPLICVCYTNHALDQFLEHLLDAGVDNVIRLGSRSQSERLQERTLIKARSGQIKTRVEKHNIWECNQGLDEIQTELEPLLERSSRPLTYADIVYYLQKISQTKGDRTHDILFAGATDGPGGGVDEDGFQVVGRKTRKDILQSWTRGKNPPGHQPMAQTPLQSLQQVDRNLSQLLRNPEDVWGMSKRERQTLRSHWEEQIQESRRMQLNHLLGKFEGQTSSLQAQYKEGDKRCLGQAHVIGVTTTGLASNSELLRSLPAKVLVCEEAAEVLEAHLISAMLPSVQHAILIGDHLQLRAQISKYELSMESEQGKKYGLDESLFERLANEEFNGAKMPIAQLDVQRRMHPSIASLVRETLYPQLRDHETTYLYPEVMGMRRRLFWLDHEHREDSSAQDGHMQTSKTNEWEAEMVVSLVKHLSRQGIYGGKEDIAVITPYLGQLRKLRKKFQTTFDLVIGDKDMDNIKLDEDEEEEQPPVPQQVEVRQGRLIDAIRLATVDNFQGEEAKIIVVSLVRSNPEHKCGFLKTSNRINVLLSRAQHGMYIIGDSQTSSGVPMWGKVIGMLEKNDNIGPNLELQCPRHPTTPLLVSNPEDFIRLSPEGGCNERCGLRLNCGHSCVVKCHSNALHQVVKCLEACIKSFSHCDHPCPKRCWEDCGNCRVPITTPITLPCGHTPSSLECHETVDLTQVKCHQIVTRQLPCGHQANIQCHIDFNKYKCKSVCGATLPCGHNCNRMCKECRTADVEKPEVIIVAHGECRNPCGRNSGTCRHSCKKLCHEGSDCGSCPQPCDVKCVHSRCPNTCSEPCGCCVELCSWTCPHGRCNMPCAVPCDRLPCSLRCTKNLECGHQCPSICGERCPGRKFCKECLSENDKILDQVVDLVMYTMYRDHEDLDEDPIVVLSCGHFYAMSTLDGHMDLRSAYQIDDAGKILGPKHFERAEMKVCPECREPLRNIHRYNRVVNGALLDEATKRFMAYAGALQTDLQNKVQEHELKLEDLANEFVQSLSAENTAFTSKTGKIQDYQRTASLAQREVMNFITQVSQAEQPYGKVQTMVIDARRRRNAVSDFELDNSVIQHGFELRGRGQLLRITWAALWNFNNISTRLPPAEHNQYWTTFVLPQLLKAKDTCVELVVDSAKAAMIRQQVEARIYFSQFVALEMNHSPIGANISASQREGVLNVELDSLKQCEDAIRENASARYLLEDIAKARNLLRGSTFYSFVSSQEKEQIYAAMANEFRGSGHWYYCQQGHPFSVGECGMPMELAKCPECDSPVGGQHHNPTAGVRRADDFEAQFGRMNIGR